MWRRMTIQQICVYLRSSAVKNSICKTGETVNWIRHLLKEKLKKSIFLFLHTFPLFFLFSTRPTPPEPRFPFATQFTKYPSSPRPSPTGSSPAYPPGAAQNDRRRARHRGRRRNFKTDL